MSNTGESEKRKQERAELREEFAKIDAEEQKIKDQRLERIKLLRHIKTARGIDAINEAVDQGYTPLKYKVKTPKRMHITEALMKNSKTGKVKTMPYHLYEKLWGPSAGYDTVEIVSYDPYNFPPYAAYLLPNDLKKGETVILEDLIEDIVGASHNGHVLSRQDSAEAVWNGKKFIIDMDSFDRSIMMG